MKEAKGVNLAEIAEELPEKARTLTQKNDAGAKKKSAAKGERLAPAADVVTEGGQKAGSCAKETAKTKKAAGTKQTKRAKAKTPNEKITPASIFRKMKAFGKEYQVETEQDFIEAARIYAEEAALIDQMRDRIDQDGLTVEKTYKTGSVEVAHPLLSELPRHVESANKCLATIANMIEERGAKKERAARDLDKFRLHR